MKILVVEDDLTLSAGICFELDCNGYLTIAAYNCKKANRLIQSDRFDLAILDVNLPDGNGFDPCRTFKDTHTELPVIFLTANHLEQDILNGFDLGADDYITKPFNILELKARIKAILRRSVKKAPVEGPVKNTLKARDLELSFDSRRVFINGKEVNLTAKEFDLLELLMENPGKVYSREKLLDTVWGYDYPGDVRTVDVHVRRLREKIEANPSEPKYIFTKWGVGYYFN